jgi:16S rRNA (guanine527-N7)-methyltransferase
VKRSDGGVAARLEALGDQWSLDPRAPGRLAQLLTMVRDDPRAATSVRTPAEAVDVHVADSLTALPWLEGAQRIADVGSGAGFPGLAIAIACPGLAVDLIEAGSRKCDFMRDAAAALELQAVQVVDARVEDWARAQGRERYDAVLARAVAPLPTVAEYAAPLLVPGGRLVAWKGERDDAEEQAGARAAQELGLAAAGVERTTPFPGSRAHTLHLYEKVRSTPARFPRRAGMARKRPLA